MTENQGVPAAGPAHQRPSGLTVPVHVGDLGRARDFYGSVFGTGPEYEPDDNLLEWRVGDGEIWLQVVGVTEPVRPLVNRVRFRVDDVTAAAIAVAQLGVAVSEVESLPSVVSWVDFTDPWANELGFYQDLAPGGQPG